MSTLCNILHTFAPQKPWRVRFQELSGELKWISAARTLFRGNAFDDGRATSRGG